MEWWLAVFLELILLFGFCLDIGGLDLTRHLHTFLLLDEVSRCSNLRLIEVTRAGGIGHIIDINVEFEMSLTVMLINEGV